MLLGCEMEDNLEKLNLIFRNKKWILPIGLEGTEIFDIHSLLEIFKNESVIWQDYSIGKIGNVHHKFNTLQYNLNQAISYFNENKNESSLESALNDINHELVNKPGSMIFSNSDDGVKIRTAYTNNERENEAIYDYFHKYFNTNYLNKEYLSGYIKAVLIDNPSFFPDSINEIIAKGNEFNFELQRVSNANIQKSDTFMNELKKKVEEIKLTGENTFTIHKNRVLEFEREYKEKFDDILINYEEKLRISGPAKYWEEMETHYREKGNRWRNCAFSIGALAVTFISSVFFYYPSHWNPEVFTIQSLKGTLLLGIAISTFIYILRISIKLTLSNYHLAVDAKERFQLSHFYLSMVKEGVFAKEDRNLVLQSLFGRAESGLLHGDSGPTLPVDLSSLKSFLGK